MFEGLSGEEGGRIGLKVDGIGEVERTAFRESSCGCGRILAACFGGIWRE